MTQLALIFPPPMTDLQLAAAARLQQLVDQTRSSFSCTDYRRRRAAALKRRER